MRITQVCSNIIFNTLRFADIDSVAKIEPQYKDEKLHVILRGHSKVILASDPANLFNANLRLRDNIHLNGKRLNLHISKQIVEQLKGSINYRTSLNGKETIFEFNLPCREIEQLEDEEEKSFQSFIRAIT